MGIKIAGYKFNGPYTSAKKIENKAGIYIVHLDKKNNYDVLDIGESAMLKDRMEHHERMKCWIKHALGKEIAISVYYTKHWSQGGRMKFVQKLRQKIKPPCGNSKLDGHLNFLQKT